MATIKNIRIEAITYIAGIRTQGYYWKTYNFKTFTDDNGNKTYYINDNEVTAEEGNAEYLRIRRDNAEYQKTEDCKQYIKYQWKLYYRSGKKRAGLTLHEADTFKQTVEEYDISYEELIARLEKSYDHYTQYIDNYKQMEQAEEHNRRIEKEIAKYRKLIAER